MPADDIARLSIDKTRTTPRRRWPLRWIAAALVVAAGLLLFSGLLRPSVKVSVAAVAAVYPSQSLTILNASGYVVAQRKAAVAAKTTGRLVWLGVEEGSRVTSGQVLARLESDDLAAAERQAVANLDVAQTSLDAAKAELADASSNLDRQKNLFSRGFATQAELDSARLRFDRARAGVAGGEASVRAARAALDTARVQLDYASIRAPFDGVVLTKNADIGDIVTPLGAAANAKSAVVTIADPASLQAEVDVTEASLGKIKVGQPCEVQLDAVPDKRFRGVVHMVVPTADRSKATVLVKVRLLDRDPRLLPEMSVKVAFLSRTTTRDEEQPRIAVPASAVRKDGGGSAAFVAGKDRIEKRTITTGVAMNDLVEVTSGLKAGERVVIDPAPAVRDGSRYTIVER